MIVRHTVVTGALAAPLPYGYEYLFAANGIFLRAQRTGLELVMPIDAGQWDNVRGLVPLRPYFRMTYPRIPAAHLEKMVQLCREAVSPLGQPLERLFHLTFGPGGWQVHLPAQQATWGSVAPVDPFDTEALVELHSHHVMAPVFSDRDDADEQGFRIYCVVGYLDRTPTLHTRVGVFGHHWSLPSALVFAMPASVQCYLESLQ